MGPSFSTRNLRGRPPPAWRRLINGHHDNTETSTVPRHASRHCATLRTIRQRAQQNGKTILAYYIIYLYVHGSQWKFRPLRPCLPFDWGCVLEFMEETPGGRGCFHDVAVDSSSCCCRDRDKYVNRARARARDLALAPGRLHAHNRRDNDYVPLVFASISCVVIRKFRGSHVTGHPTVDFFSKIQWWVAPGPKTVHGQRSI